MIFFFSSEKYQHLTYIIFVFKLHICPDPIKLRKKLDTFYKKQDIA
jgi:hypothetical protein